MRRDATLAELTTLHLGGPARQLLEVTEEAQLVDAVAAADAAGEPVLVLAGGSNVVIADAGFAGTVVHVRTRGVTMTTQDSRVRVAVAAGEPWDQLVAQAVADGIAGIECLAGIPGSAGATPIQNVGAYGQQVSDGLVSVRVFDRVTGCVVELDNADCGFGYRSSLLRRSGRYVVLGLSLELERSARGHPVRYPALASALGVMPGARPPLVAVRDAVLALRRAKGMVIDPDDPDSVSAGSFFLNPVLPAARFAELQRRVRARLGAGARPPAWASSDGAVKTSAAWLIEHAGLDRGFSTGRVGISTKHPLALVNRGGASTSELIALAREIRRRVHDVFGVTLRPEPTLVGVGL